MRKPLSPLLCHNACSYYDTPYFNLKYAEMYCCADVFKFTWLLSPDRPSVGKTYSANTLLVTDYSQVVPDTFGTCVAVE